MCILILSQNKSYKKSFILILWSLPSVHLKPPPLCLSQLPLFSFSPCPILPSFTLFMHRHQPTYLLLPPRFPFYLIDLSLSIGGPGNTAKAELLSWSGKSIDFLMCSFLFSSQTVFDLVSPLQAERANLVSLSAVVVVFQDKVVAISLQSQKLSGVLSSICFCFYCISCHGVENSISLQ